MKVDYTVEEIEFRSIREDDKFLVTCNYCGATDITYDRRWPSKDCLEYLYERMCACDSLVKEKQQC